MSKRTFTIIGAYNSKGCPTKVRKNTTYKGSTPGSAAKKAFTELCRVKQIRGVATFYVVIREKTQGSSKKVFSYLLRRKKLKKPLLRFEGTDKEFKILYENTIKSAQVPSYTNCKTHKQSRGKMKKKSTLVRGGNDDEGLCVICLDKKADYAIKPCGHLCLCEDCTSAIGGKCPICRGGMNGVMKIFNLPDIEEVKKEVEREAKKEVNMCNEEKRTLLEFNMEHKKEIENLKANCN